MTPIYIYVLIFAPRTQTSGGRGPVKAHLGLCFAVEEREILPVEEMLALFGLESSPAGRRVRLDQRLLGRHRSSNSRRAATPRG